MTDTSFDLETELIDRACLAPPPVSASWQRRGQSPCVALIADWYPHFVRLLASSDRLIGQNLAYDMACMCTYDPGLIPGVFEKYRRGEAHDVGLREKLIRIGMLGSTDPAYGLDTLCEIYRLPPVDKGSVWRTSFASLKNVPVIDWPDSARSYVLDDADRPLRIFDLQDEIDQKWIAAHGRSLLTLSGSEAYKAFACHLISCKGLFTDQARTETLHEELVKALDAVRDNLIKAGFVRADGTRNTKAVKEYTVDWCRRENVPVPLTKGKDVSLSKDTLDAMPDELLSDYSIYSQAGTYISRVEDMQKGYVLPLQPRFNSLLETGRTSTSKPGPPLVGVQAQNFPRKIAIGKNDQGKTVYASVGARECLRPSAPDRVFVVNDLPTAELRSVAQQCMEWFGASRLADVINEGKDVHAYLAAPIIGKPYEYVMANKDTDPWVKEKRDEAKPANFGFWGGMKERSFIGYSWKGYRILFTFQQAEQIRNFWSESFPENIPFFARVDSMMGTDAAIRWVDPLGQTRWMPTTRLYFDYSGRWRGRVPYTAACNSFFQPRTADGAADGLKEVQRRCFSVRSSALYGSWACMYTHDEIVLDSPASVAHDAAMELAQVMADCFNVYHRDVPIKELDPYVTRIYSKAAKPVKGADGRLIPWTPK